MWIPGLPGGRYQLRVSRAGMQPREEVVEITPPAEDLTTLELRKRTARSGAAESNLKKALDLYTKGGASHYQDALAVLEKVRAQYPTDPELPYRIGLIQKVEGSAGTASAAFEAALALDASHLMARTMLADLRVSEQPSEAIRLLLKAPELTANDVLSTSSFPVRISACIFAVKAFSGQRALPNGRPRVAISRRSLWWNTP